MVALTKMTTGLNEAVEETTGVVGDKAHPTDAWGGKRWRRQRPMEVAATYGHRDGDVTCNLRARMQQHITQHL